MEQAFLRLDARQKRRDESDSEEYAHAGAKRQPPAQRAHEQTEIARVPDEAVNAGGDQRVTGLDGDQAAESASQDKHGPDPQPAARSEQRNAKPADGIAVEG